MPKDKRITGLIVALVAVLMMILGYVLFSRSLEQRFGRGVFPAGNEEPPTETVADSVPARRSAAQD